MLFLRGGVVQRVSRAVPATAASDVAATVGEGLPPSVWTQRGEPTRLALSGAHPTRGRLPPLRRSHLVRVPLATTCGGWLAAAQWWAARSCGREVKTGPGITREGEWATCTDVKKQSAPHLALVLKLRPDRANMVRHLRAIQQTTETDNKEKKR